MSNSVATINANNFQINSDAYLGNLLQVAESMTNNFGDHLNTSMEELKQKFAREVVKLNIPNNKDEAWRFTDLSDLQKIDFHAPTKQNLSDFILDGFKLQEAPNSRLVFVNGFYDENLSDISALPDGVYVGNLTNLDGSKKEKVSHFLGQNHSDNEVFSALNTAGINDAFVVWVDKNVEVDIPIHLLHIVAKEDLPIFIQPRILMIGEVNSRCQIIEYYGATSVGCSDAVGGKPYFTNVVTEIHLQENASLSHCRIQRESGDGFHIAQSAIAQYRNSSYTINEISLGGKLYRHNLDILQKGEQTYTNLHGLTMVQGKQIADTHSHVSLNHPYGTVNQLHKYILDDSGHGIFNGRVDVPKLAQETNAAQLNRNLLLSPKARINTKPELQITADNVKCAHGATVSQLEADEIFYLRSRGLNEDDARHLLLDAFAGEIIEKIPYQSLRQRLTQCVACRTID
ncbi:Fe-S cluster assembly protein SufD [Cyanobacterium stanieri LEGE 03274]|uniref:Fe-S cluster assembly protein SufD n=1 Tax=Cyanobacterium stanieri LEGE 03274 TaxID=1828756 RepID=A0ABR9V3K6_9CHRO|nr:Fe-S cluster assembly protein SufD [Cyanobacterium stanieri]MBE9222470.1 Fe-S cluster assembly protein SufD [Cyanobacterium stanieri LEGE 03274]